MLLKCKRKSCLYEWDFKGKARFYATCPICLSKVKVVEDFKIYEEDAKPKETIKVV